MRAGNLSAATLVEEYLGRIDAREAEKQLDALLDEVECGEAIAARRDGRMVAMLAPVRSQTDREQARRTADALTLLSDGLTLAGLSVKELTAEGRK